MSGQVLYTYKAGQLWLTVRIHRRKELRNRFDSLFVTKNNLSSTKLWKKDLVSFLHTHRDKAPILCPSTSTSCNHYSWIQLQTPTKWTPQNAPRKHMASEFFNCRKTKGVEFHHLHSLTVQTQVWKWLASWKVYWQSRIRTEMSITKTHNLNKLFTKTYHIWRCYYAFCRGHPNLLHFCSVNSDNLHKTELCFCTWLYIHCTHVHIHTAEITVTELSFCTSFYVHCAHILHIHSAKIRITENKNKKPQWNQIKRNLDSRNCKPKSW